MLRLVSMQRLGIVAADAHRLWSTSCENEVYAFPVYKITGISPPHTVAVPTTRSDVLTVINIL